jgi:hypothetical protein
MEIIEVLTLWNLPTNLNFRKMNNNIIFRWVLNFFELQACIIGLLYWGRSKGSYLQKFAFILLLIFATELFGKYLSFNINLHKYNPILYRYWGTPLQFIFFFWLYFQEFKITKNKQLPIYVGSCYLISWIIDEIFNIKPDWKWFPSLSFGIGVVCILLLVVFYFLNLMKNEKIVFFYRQPLFWISFGLLIGYITIIPLFTLRNGLNKQHIELLTTYWKIGIILNCIMYLLFSISFLCTKKKL